MTQPERSEDSTGSLEYARALQLIASGLPALWRVEVDGQGQLRMLPPDRPAQGSTQVYADRA